MALTDQNLISIRAPGGKTAPVAAVLNAIADGGFRIDASQPGGGRYGVAFLVPFYRNSPSHVLIRIDAGSSATFRIEVCGYATRMQKAYIEFDASGKLLRRGEEISAASVIRANDGELEIKLEFVAPKSRMEWLYLFSESTVGMGGENGAAYFTCKAFEFYGAPPSGAEREIIPVAATESGVIFTVDALWVFRNYFQVEFEIYKAGAKLSGLSLASAIKLENIQWWTHQEVKLGESGNNVGVVLNPRRPPLALPSPHLMERVGPGCAWLGHSISAMFGEFQEARLWNETQSEQALSSIVLHASFDDGTQVQFPLTKGGGAAPECDPELGWIKEYGATIRPDRRPEFLEVGARGPASTIMRSLVEGDYKYTGVDMAMGANVDIAGDAHLLSDFIDKGSIDVVYTNCVMEHLLNPAKFAVESNKVLRMGGMFVATVPITWPLHAEPWDYWRMSPHAWPSLLNHMSGFEIISVREHGEATVVPSLAGGAAMAGMQHSPAPLFSSIVARKVGEIPTDWHAWSPQLASGDYDP